MIRRLTPQNAAGLDAAITIYQTTIPLSEQKSPAALRAMLHRPEYAFDLALADDAVLGMAIGFHARTFALLEYLLVAPHAQGRGIGSALFGHLTKSLNGKPLLVEADTEGEDPPSAARQRFYRRLGCRNIEGLAYLLPLATPHGPPPPMDLLIYGAPAPLSRPILGGYLAVIYREVYAQPIDDPRLTTMLAPLPDILSLRQ